MLNDIAFFGYVMDIEKRRDDIDILIKNIGNAIIYGLEDSIPSIIEISELAPFTPEEYRHIRRELSEKWGVMYFDY